MVKALRNCNIDFFASNDFGIAFSLWEKRSSFDITSETTDASIWIGICNRGEEA